MEENFQSFKNFAPFHNWSNCQQNNKNIVGIFFHFLGSYAELPPLINKKVFILSMAWKGTKTRG